MQHARATGDEALYAATQNAVGWVLALRGDLRGAIEAYRLGLANPALSPFMRAHLALNLVAALIEMGDLDRAEAGLDALGDAGFPHAEYLRRLRRAQIARWRGDFAAALPTFETAWADSHVGSLPPHPNTAWISADQVDCLLALDRREEALSLAGGLVERSESLGLRFGAGVHGSALARATGEPADHERAVATLAATPYKGYEARARLEYGSALRRSGKRVEAREQLRLALDYYERNGVRHLGARAREELEVSGARLRDVAVLSGADALTPSESRIARLAADGLSNKEIAQHLFVTVGTVQTTLVHVYRKLDIAGRKEIAAVLG
jgi:DNA-binding CsgD family transcriptional regulator